MERGPLRQRLLTDPVMPLMLRLALPVIAVLVLQTMVSVAETFYVSFLGTDALAGVTLVFPVVTLMTMMSAGGIGGGVSSAVARAVGAGRTADADALLLHALVLAIVFGGLFALGALTAGPTLFRALGGSGRALDAAVTYARFVFIGAVPLWMVNLFAAAMRGAGDVRTPTTVSLIGAALLVVLSPALIFGIGPFPRLGIAGAGTAVTLFYSFASLALIRIMASGRTGLTLRWSRLESRLFADILRVGLLSAVGTLQLNGTVVLITGAVGMFGADALAGYGIASRLDYVQIPLLFGLGTAVITLVGSAAGAGDRQRVRKVAWTGALLAACVTETIGLIAAAIPLLWLRLFSDDPAVLAAGAIYLHRVGPAYGATGLGMLLYFASQGYGQVVVPFIAGTIRLAVAAGGGWLAIACFGAPLPVLFVIVAAGAILSGTITAAGVAMRLRQNQSSLPVSLAVPPVGYRAAAGPPQALPTIASDRRSWPT